MFDMMKMMGKIKEAQEKMKTIKDQLPDSHLIQIKTYIDQTLLFFLKHFLMTRIDHLTIL